MSRFHRYISLLCLMLLGSMSSQGAVITDTVYSDREDRVIITYELSHNENKATIEFKDAKKMLKGSYKEKYSKLSYVKVMFFDRVGNYGDNAKFTGKSPKAFTVPAYAHSHRSKEGYFIVDEGATITFEVDNGQTPTLKIPIFLAHYENKRQYTIFSECAPLTINLWKKKDATKKNPKQSQPTYEKQLITQQVLDTVYGKDEPISKDDDAEMTISHIKSLLTDYGANSDLIESSKQHLMSIRSEVSPKIRSEIDQVIKSCNDKKKDFDDIKRKEAEDKAKQDSINRLTQIKQEKDKKADRLINDIKKRLDKGDFSTEDETLSGDVNELRTLKNDIDNQAIKDQIDEVLDRYDKKKEDEKKKRTWRNILLGIGAALLGMLGIGGNQMLQNRRNAKNQKSMMDFQQKMVSRAENEAKRRARSIVRNKTHQAVNQVKSKGRKAIQSNASKLGNAVKGKKNSLGNNNDKKNSLGNSRGKKNDNGGISI